MAIQMYKRLLGAIYNCRYCPPRFESNIGSKEPKNRLKLIPLTVFKCLFLSMAAMLSGGEMMEVRKSKDRGQGGNDWLTTQYTFSFADYYDPNFMGFRTLRVLNEDWVDPSQGFDTHPHKDMEILTYVMEGTLEHRDTLGNRTQIKRGEFQVQSAGIGIQHSEMNPSAKETVHLLQIWILPEKKGLAPRYEQKSFSDHRNGLCLVASSEGKEGTLKIHQDARIYLGRFGEGEEGEVNLGQGRHAWVQVTQGEVEIEGVMLGAGDGAAVSKQERVSFTSRGESEFLLFDLK